MKKVYTIIFLLISSITAFSQCQSVVTVNGAACDSLCSGLALWSFNGGQLPLTLSVNGGPNIQVTTAFTQGNLCPGLYTYTVVDAGGDTCTGMNSFNIQSSGAPDGQVNVVNATCGICSDGSATISNVIGGVPPYNYQWSNGATGGSITNLIPGIYYVYITDANGCTDVDTVIIGVGNNGFYALQGQVFFDANNNGVKDVGENGVANQNVTLAQGSINAITNFNGEYAFVVVPGTYDISYLGLTGWNQTTTPLNYNPTLVLSSINGLDFGIYPDSSYTGFSVSLSSSFPRCFWDINHNLSIYNSGFTNLSGTLTFNHDPLQTFVSSSVVPNSSSGTQYTFDFINLGPGQLFTVQVNLTEPAGLIPVALSLNVTGTDSNGLPFNGGSTLNQVTSCSYDPNDESVQPIGIGQLNYISSDQWLEYLVRFQNTGNDTAFTVVVLDTIDAGLDLSTFTLLGYSHPVDVTINPGREVEFRFTNILLPDSIIDEPGSHGYILYKIKGNVSNPDPTSVFNTAYIYFDQNLPVVTNSTLSTFSDNFLGIAAVSNKSNLFSIFPNPMNNGAMLKYVGNDFKEMSVELYDITGRVVREQQLMQSEILFISKEGLSSGTYLLKINSDSVDFLRLVVQ